MGQPPSRQVDHSAVWENQGVPGEGGGLEWEAAALFLQLGSSLGKPPLISMPWAPICKMEDQMG